MIRARFWAEHCISSIEVLKSYIIRSQHHYKTSASAPLALFLVLLLTWSPLSRDLHNDELSDARITLCNFYTYNCRQCGYLFNESEDKDRERRYLRSCESCHGSGITVRKVALPRKSWKNSIYIPFFFSRVSNCYRAVAVKMLYNAASFYRNFLIHLLRNLSATPLSSRV